MFSSRTLTDRNNDWCPWLDEQTGFRYMTDNPTRPHWAVWSPDPRYQFGTLPENPILTRLRKVHANPLPVRSQTLAELAEAWLYFWDSSWGSNTDTEAQRTHAHRVLTLLAAVTR